MRRSEWGVTRSSEHATGPPRPGCRPIDDDVSLTVVRDPKRQGLAHQAGGVQVRGDTSGPRAEPIGGLPYRHGDLDLVFRSVRSKDDCGSGVAAHEFSLPVEGHIVSHADREFDNPPKVGR